MTILSPWEASTASTHTGSNLTDVDLREVTIAKEDFSTFLYRSQLLEKLTLIGVSMVGSSAPTVLANHSNVKHLAAPLRQIMTGTPTQPTLFAYFPLLKHWTVNEPGHSNVPQVDVDASLLRREITRHCPFLKSVQMGRVNGSNGAKLLVGVLVGLERFVMCPAELTSDVLLGILKHQETLTQLNSSIEAGATMRLDTQRPDSI
ncbi:hypothetical protein BGX33_002849 [Mortierella sp. NVP41]|nr:hypothetical protein BGX33_002849 [Mortierella sp. NVP41]